MARIFYLRQTMLRETASLCRRYRYIVIPRSKMPGTCAGRTLTAYPGVGCRGEDMPCPPTTGVFDDVMCRGDRVFGSRATRR